MGLFRNISRVTVLLAAGVFLLIGVASTHKVYEADGDFGVLVFERISEVELVEVATFSGVYARDGRLIRHEWAARREGKQPCPT
jgi:hypothetical protein